MQIQDKDKFIEDAKLAIQRRLEGSLNMSVAKQLGVGQITAIKIKRGLPASAQFDKVVDFVLTTLIHQDKFTNLK